jgi:hypothetical protein
MGNRGGGCLTIPASDCVLSPVVDLDRKLVLDVFLFMVKEAWPGNVL